MVKLAITMLESDFQMMNVSYEELPYLHTIGLVQGTFTVKDNPRKYIEGYYILKFQDQ